MNILCVPSIDNIFASLKHYYSILLLIDALFACLGKEFSDVDFSSMNINPTHSVNYSKNVTVYINKNDFIYFLIIGALQNKLYVNYNIEINYFYIHKLYISLS